MHPYTLLLSLFSQHAKVLVNLVSNAFKFTNSGSITVTAWCEPYPRQPEALGVSSIVSSVAPKSVLEVGTGDIQGGVGASVLPSTTYPSSLLRAAQRSAGETSQEPSDVARGKGIMRWVTAPWGLQRTRKKNQQDDQSVFFQSVGTLKHKPAFLRVEVTDSGMGMSPEEIGQLFEPFPQVGRDPCIHALTSSKPSPPPPLFF